ncbi:hypothetical protein GCM10009104_19960 [Marinobacterium maritimum]|uniref:Porin domain-containing protein n=2 Tax=Marinobacterium maritimum TaxID=500162 RepID=A0ABN1I6P1_9GAMM
MFVMKKMAFAIALATLPLMGQAAEFSKPEAYGFLSAGALKTDNQDFEAEAFEIELGLKGKVQVKDLNLLYQLEVDLAQAANRADSGDPGKDGEDDIHIKEAVMRLPTQYGTFVLAPRGTSGQWAQLYGPINHYEYNEPHAALHADGIFVQPDRTSGTFAWASPAIANTRLVMAAITLKEDNGEDADAASIRIVYNDGQLHLGAGTTLIKAEQLPAFTQEDLLLTALSAGYDFGQVQLGAVWEHSDNQPYPFAPKGAADSDSFGISANINLGTGYGMAVGYKEKDHDYDAADESVYMLKLEKQLDDQVKVWAETGQYDRGDSNYALGVNLRF